MKPQYVGILAAAGYIIFKMVLFFTGSQHDVLVKTPWLPLMVLVVLGIFYAINHYIRTSDTYEWITAFKKGLTVALVAAVIAGLFIYIYYRFIDPDFLELRQVEAYNAMKDQVSKDKLQKLVDANKTVFSPGIYSVAAMFLINATGLLGSMIVAFMARFMLVRKK